MFSLHSNKQSIPSLVFRIVNVIVFVAVVLTTSLTNKSTSDNYQTYLTPAVWTFAIWGLIFLLQAASVIYTLIPVDYPVNDNKLSAVAATGWLWIFGWGFEIAWAGVFVVDHIAAVCVSAVLIVCATGCFYWSVKHLREHPPLQSFKTWRHTVLYILYVLPASINAAWLTVATSLNILIIPSYLNASATVEVSLALCFAVCVTLVGLSNLVIHLNLPYGAALIWAFGGILANQVHRTVCIALLVCISLIGTGMLYVAMLLARELYESRRDKGRFEMDIDTDTEDEEFDKL